MVPTDVCYVAAGGELDGVPDDEALGRIARNCTIEFAHEPGDPLPKRVVVDGADVGDRHVNEADGLVGGLGLVA